MASAAARTFSDDTLPAKWFQLFQPICGVRQIVSPMTRLIVALSTPRALVAVNSTGWVPLSEVVPVRLPVFGSSVSPAGRPFAANVSGRSPVTGRW